MRNAKLIALLFAAATSLAPLAKAQTTIISGWDFQNSSTSGTAPASDLGAVTGTAQSIGMSGYGNSTSDVSNIYQQSGSSDTAATNYVWRIQGGTGKSNNNGWNTAAPIATQGAQFFVSTVGYNNVSLSFDISTSSSTAENNLAIEYTLDGGGTWTVATSAQISLGTGAATIASGTDANTTSTYISLNNSSSNATWQNGITVNFSAITGASNNANFGVELVNASTGTDDVNGSGSEYGNSGGNWRFDEVQVSGTASAIPELSTYGLIFGGLPFAGVVVMRIRGRRSARGQA